MQHAAFDVCHAVMKLTGAVVLHQGLLDSAVCVQGAAPGALDGYLDRILPVLEADLFGDIAEAKEADAFAAKYRYVALAKAFHYVWSVSHVLQTAMKHHLPALMCNGCYADERHSQQLWLFASKAQLFTYAHMFCVPCCNLANKCSLKRKEKKSLRFSAIIKGAS